MTSEILKWAVWGGLLILQNAAFTMVSRARNSGSLTYHAVAAVGSNGVWFLSQLILLDNMLALLKTGDWKFGVLTAAFYTACTITGSVGMHWLALHKIEKGKRKVGSE